MIDRDHALPITRQAQLLGISRGAVVCLPRPTSPAELDLMRRMGIEALAPQPGTSKRAPGHKIYPYLLRTLVIDRSNQVWALETTYIPMARGFVYLTAVVDVASRRVLAHKVAITLAACHAREVIEQALARWGKPDIVNTDPGSQLTACEFTDAATLHRLQPARSPLKSRGLLFKQTGPLLAALDASAHWRRG